MKYLIAVLLLVSSIASAESYRLSSVVSTGTTGNKPVLFHEEINMGDTLAARMAALEALRQESILMDRESKIVIGVDVNENASGTEKAESQAVALKSVRLEITMNDGTEYTLTDFSTLTQALLAEGNETAGQRKPYYTLLGRSGSNAITGSVFRDSFDSTLSIPVPENVDFNNAVSVTLHIDFLNTNSKLGDPELFYDYTNGFEDLAVLTDADGRYLDNVAKGILLNGEYLDTEDPVSAGAPMVINLRDKQAPYVEWIGYPSSTGYYVVGYEDLYPYLGDYDFNDLTVAYRVELGLDLNSEVKQIRGQAILVTRGAAYDHNWILNIGMNTTGTITESLYNPTPDGHGELASSDTRQFNGELSLAAFINTLTVFPAPAGCKFTNTECAQYIQGPKYIYSVVLNQPISFGSVQSAPFDPTLYVINTKQEIHLPGNGGSYIDENGFPFAMIMPQPWNPLVEAIRVEDGYIDFPEYVQTNGNSKKDWYTRPVQVKVHGNNRFTWEW